MNDFLAIQRRWQCNDAVAGVGFCLLLLLLLLLLRSSALNQAELLDPACGHDYCEESDPRMRLTAAEFRNMVAEDVYVYRRGGGSFDDGQERYLCNRQLFDQRWGTEYHRQFRAFRRTDPLQSSGRRTTVAYCHRREARDTLAWIERVVAAETAP